MPDPTIPKIKLKPDFIVYTNKGLIVSQYIIFLLTIEIASGFQPGVNFI